LNPQPVAVIVHHVFLACFKIEVQYIEVNNMLACLPLFKILQKKEKWTH